MSSFPPKQWEMRFLKDLDNIQGTVHEEHEVSLESYLAVQPSGGEEGSFRFVLAGPRHLHIRIKVTDVIPEAEFENMWITMQLELGTQIKIEKNSVTSKWLDIVEMVMAQDADITDEEGEELNDQFLEAFEKRKDKARPDKSGIALRWLLGTFGEDNQIHLVAQMLPCSLEVIEANAALRSDHTRGIMAAKWPVHYEKFDDEVASGKLKIDNEKLG